ncbi:MAG TPA: serine/threonine-protein kinase [Kofleriaceae bacterium]|nr:serine/threonine-protein kinase [Kofleriaceae bacterium]
MTSPADTLIGTVVDGRFEIRDKIGEGGMGAVYRAWQRSTEREIAMKLIAKHQLNEPMAIERFLREAKLASQLAHPNTISVYDFGKLADGRLFIAMEMVRGKSLGRVLKTEGALAFDRVVRIGIQICDALAAAHALQIIHRDLKPDNVMVIDGTADLIKVLDFGLAKRVNDKGLNATAAGVVVGTPRYIPPESVMTGATYAEGDLYALGVILAEMALGRPLWRAAKSSSLADILQVQLKPAEHLREIPEPLRAIVASLVDPTPAMRPSASQLRAQLVALQSGSMPRNAQPSSPPPSASTPQAQAPQSPWARPTAHSTTIPDASPSFDSSAPTIRQRPASAAPPAPARPPAASRRSKDRSVATPTPRPRRWALFALGCLGVGIVVGAIAFALTRHDAEKQVGASPVDAGRVVGTTAAIDASTPTRDAGVDAGDAATDTSIGSSAKPSTKVRTPKAPPTTTAKKPCGDCLDNPWDDDLTFLKTEKSKPTPKGRGTGCQKSMLDARNPECVKVYCANHPNEIACMTD